MEDRTEKLLDSLTDAIDLARYDRGGDWSEEYEALKTLADRSRQLDRLIEAVELRMAIAAAYQPLPAERRRLGLLAGIPAAAGTPTMGQLRRAANKKLDAVLATCKSEKAPPQAVSSRRCDLGVGCEEAGVCYAAAHGEPDRCGMSTE